MNELERVLKALANKRRLAILKVLKRGGRKHVGQVAQAIHLSLKATSKHLGILFGANIIEREQQGLLMWYSLAPSLPEAARVIVHLL